GELGAADRLEVQAAALADHLDLAGFEGAHVPLRVPQEALGGDRVDALATLLVSPRDPEDVRPLRPWVVGRPRVRRPAEQLELVNRGRALAVDVADAGGARVAAADDDDTLALGLAGVDDAD